MTKAIKAGGAYNENAAWCNAKLAEMLLSEGAVLPAENILKDAAKVAPNDYHILAAMGRVKTALGKYPEAITLYQKAVAVAPEHTGLVALGDLYRATGQKAKAEETYGLVEKLHEEHKKYGSADELYMARFFAEHDRQLPRALAIAEMHKDAKNAVAADTVAWCYYKSNKLPEAKAAITRALTAAEPDAPALYHAGMIAARLGTRPAAQKYLYQAMSRDPHFSLLDAPIAAETLKTLGSSRPTTPLGGVAAVGQTR
ncbi:MAG: tetratricopeptide repeat protein [Cytophagales bacterium]|nr:tetratricopeptide repeat protein [Armatimonadota bacterium]